jgi:hypothetical protein
MEKAFLPYLIGLVPILLARSWPARIVAIVFGCASIGLGAYYVWIIQNTPDVTTGVQRIGPAVIGAFCVALISLVTTYFVDKKYCRKS